jgi:hypothetical protein
VLSVLIPQGELEHRSPKSWYARTSRKQYVHQLAQIERHRSRIQRIRNKNKLRPESEEVPPIPEAHHIIGKSQNFPEKIPLFLEQHAGDPAIKVR